MQPAKRSSGPADRSNATAEHACGQAEEACGRAELACGAAVHGSRRLEWGVADANRSADWSERSVSRANRSIAPTAQESTDLTGRASHRGAR
jgi:hypothetical protein